MHTFILLATIIYAWKYFGQCTLEFNISLHHIRLNLNRFQSWRVSLYVILISVFQVVSLYNMDECRFALFSTSCTHYHNGHTCFYSCPGCISSGRVNLGHFLAVQMCFILHRFYIPRLLSLSCSSGLWKMVWHCRSSVKNRPMERDEVSVCQTDSGASCESTTRAHSWSGIHLP